MTKRTPCTLFTGDDAEAQCTRAAFANGETRHAYESGGTWGLAVSERAFRLEAIQIPKVTKHTRSELKEKALRLWAETGELE